MHDFEGTETMGNFILNFVRHFSHDIFLIHVYTIKSCVLHYCVLTNKRKNVHYTVLYRRVTDSRLNLTLWPKCQMMLCTSCILGDRTGCVSHAAAVKLAEYCGQFLDKNVKYYLIISSLGVKHIWALNEAFLSPARTCSELLYVFYIIYEKI
jgi:hypothetical protein